MRILVLTFYYTPDLCAGSFRMTPFVERLKHELGGGGEVDVITTMPNRYQSFSAEAPADEEEEGLHVRRVALPPHASGMVDQARAFTAYARTVLRLTRGKQYDIVFATSSRLFTAYLGARVARRTGAALYLDIRDIFTETISEVLGHSPLRAVSPVLNLIERYTVRAADRVNLVSEGFRPHFERIDGAKRYRSITNGIDEEFVSRDYTIVGRRAYRKLVYAGNIGEGQGLARIIPELARRAGPAYRFVIVGDGGARQKLEQAVEQAAVDNVELHAPVTREALRDIYADADGLFLHLNDLKAFRRVLPSKIFEYAATGKPILAGVSGYAAEFLRTHVSNAAVFSPCNAEEAWGQLRSLSFETKTREGFLDRFSRKALMQELVADVLSMREESEVVA